jgi:hypothetical protein
MMSGIALKEIRIKDRTVLVCYIIQKTYNGLFPYCISLTARFFVICDDLSFKHDADISLHWEAL